MTLEEEGSGIQIQADKVGGLRFPNQDAVQQPTYSTAQPPNPSPTASQTPPGASPYPRPAQQSNSDGSIQVVLAWVFGAIGIFICPIGFSTAGIILAAIAKSKGHRLGLAALVFCCISLVAGMTFGFITVMNMQRSGMFPR